ncbi:MAG: 3'(2'),5'-bisphosphate nucleotidase CysQ [Cyclobacteriaceae bacterium]|nr:3'(2'),5'-bisphosphate nucleotidase CysQ [Cyclobacteriaceae bacterium]MDH4298544.1 3'(2'),5'-bisphosphate nucleotidase CysQ [Cyclobacteriaceae bacterium]
MTINYKTLLPLAITAAEKASEEILKVYRSSDFEAEAKGDNSPLTLADKNAHHTIASILQSSNLPILSEEGKSIPYAARCDWEYFWMVDPLDGTKEFIKRNDEFTVNIALIHEGIPVMGVVAVPVTGDVYYATEGEGAFLKRSGKEIALPVRGKSDLKQKGLRVVASRSHMSEETKDFIAGLDEATLVSAGSSLKFMLLAEGKADVYPRYAPTMEWDTAAAHAVISEVGMQVTQYGSDKPLVYNKENLLNPYFLVH